MVYHLVPVEPFRLDLTAWTLRRRSRNHVDRWDGATYRRALATSRGDVELAVRQIGGSRAPRLRVEAVGAVAATTRRMANATLERALGLRIDLRPFYRMAARDVKLARLARAFRGMKPPRFPNVFEALTNAIACQQLSLTVGLELLNRLAATCASLRPDKNPNVFPGPGDLAKLSSASLQGLGFSRQKTRALPTRKAWRRLAAYVLRWVGAVEYLPIGASVHRRELLGAIDGDVGVKRKRSCCVTRHLRCTGGVNASISPHGTTRVGTVVGSRSGTRTG